jgi:tetratricopeptide (TPR) repeat protein
MKVSYCGACGGRIEVATPADDPNECPYCRVAFRVPSGAGSPLSPPPDASTETADWSGVLDDAAREPAAIKSHANYYVAWVAAALSVVVVAIFLVALIAVQSNGPRFPIADRANEAVSRGNSHILYGNYDAAIADCTEAIQLDPSNAPAHATRGEAYRLKQEYEKAFADLNVAIILDPKQAMPYSRRGAILVVRRDYDKAITDFDTAIRLDPELAMAYGCRGDAYCNIHDYIKAIDDYNKAIRLKPDWAGPRLGRARAHSQTGDYDKAIADYTEAIRLGPPNPMTYHYRGLVYMKLGKSDEAVRDFERAKLLERGEQLSGQLSNRARDSGGGGGVLTSRQN